MFFDYQNNCNKKEKSVVSDLFIDYFSYEYTYQCNNKDYNFVTFQIFLFNIKKIVQIQDIN